MSRGRKLADRHTRKKQVGRPPLPGGREALNLTLPIHAKRWLLNRPIGASGQVLAWVDEAIAKERDLTG